MPENISSLLVVFNFSHWEPCTLLASLLLSFDRLLLSELCVLGGTFAFSLGNIGSAADRARSRWLEFLSEAFLLSN
jgi:hypothetical protein